MKGLLAEIDLGDGAGVIGLTPNYKWVVADEGDGGAAAAAALANASSVGYSYSPADGHPGGLLAMRMADKLGGKVSLPQYPPAPEGAVY